MRYDKNYAYFRPHPEWYTFVNGVGYVPTDKAPPEAVNAMQEYNKDKMIYVEGNMRAVKDSFNITDATVLVCEMFDDEAIIDFLYTNIGCFNKDEFVVEKIKACFSAPTTRNIVVKKANLSKKINRFMFI